MSAKDLLIEIGTEELPPKSLLTLSQAFKNEFEKLLQASHLDFNTVETFAAPRRLALKIKNLSTKQNDLSVERYGPAIQAAFDKDGNPTKAAEGFARSCNVSVTELDQKDDGKAVKLFFSATKPGANTVDLIPDLLKQALNSLPIPKKMRWGSSREEFVRPVHWVVLLFGDELIPASILGVQSDSFSYGHRFHHPEKIELSTTDDYPTLLSQKGFVEPSFAVRKELINKLILQEANSISATAIIDQALLDEVTALVEWPVALLGSFDKDYLDVPKEAIISSLKAHQKCFYLLNDKEQLLPNFITISNLVSTNTPLVIQGNEKVIGPRLADAAFFFNQDKKQKLESNIETLKRVIFQKELGSVYEKSSRVRNLSIYISNHLNFKTDLAARAAELSKCDLLSNMVGEFADLQGVMGRYYALNDGEDSEVAAAIEEQYLPRFAGDILPSTETGIVLALSERIDTIVGLFGIGQPPTGSKDPFALRRAALGVLRIILEKQIPLNLGDCISHSIQSFDNLPALEGLHKKVNDFIYDRLKAYYADLGIDAKVFQAVDAVRPQNPLQFDQQLKAVNYFSKLPEAESLSAANKRVSNILAKLNLSSETAVSESLLTEPAEVELYHSLKQVLASTSPLIEEQQYQQALEEMTSLQTPLDKFFESVMVNADDAHTKNNRQALLYQIRLLFLQIADISFLQAA